VYHKNSQLPKQTRDIARDQISKALGILSDEDMKVGKQVHQLRCSCKAGRAFFKLFKPDLGKEFERGNQTYREMSRQLSAWRNADMLLHAYDVLMEEVGNEDQWRQCSPIRRALLDVQLSASAHAASESFDLNRFSKDLKRLDKRVCSWRLKGLSWGTIQPRLVRRYRKALKAMKRAEQGSSSELFHEWRKQSKCLMHQLQLFVSLAPKRLKRDLASLKQLTAILGEEHDLSVMEAFVKGEQHRLGSPITLNRFLRILHRRQGMLRREALRLGACVFKDRPAVWSRRLSEFWRPGVKPKAG